jgi:two-component system OmpR family sensor kinase
MLDLTTSILLLTATLLLQSIGWLIVWLSQRHLYRVTLMAGGFMIYALAMVTIILRDSLPGLLAPLIIGHNLLIMLANAMVTQGLAGFLGQRGYPYVMAGCVVFAAAFWPAALILAPENVGIRVLASNALTIVAVVAMIRIVAADRTQPALLRWSAIGLFTVEFAALVIRSVVTVRLMQTPEPAFEAMIQSWYFFFFQVFITAIFLILLLMVGLRMAADLQMRNETLQREVAERRRLQDQLSAALENEQALRQEQRQLLRMVTHEFRTPLAVVDRAAEMIGVVLPAPPDSVTKRLDSIRDAVRRLVLLIDRFLDVERRDTGILQPERIDIASLIAAVRRHFEGMDAADRLTFAVDDGLPFYRGDPDMLSTVLINLIDNALKYAPDGSPVAITARQEKNTIVLTVSDQGIGIPAAEAASIGRRFFRASNTTPATGTGLGLHNARRLLDYHNGVLTLQPGDQSGTKASIRLPLPGVPISLGYGMAS